MYIKIDGDVEIVKRAFQIDVISDPGATSGAVSSWAAHQQPVGFIPVRKKGKLPRAAVPVVLKGKTKAIAVWEPLQADDSRGRFHFPLCRGLCHAEGTDPRGRPVFEGLAREAPTIPVSHFISAESAKALQASLS